MLSVAGIRVTIKGFIILRGVTLDIPAGERIALVGRNGAGKTTTLKSIMGLMPVTGGTIQLDGADLLSVPGHRRAALGIGYMPEDRRLIGALTVEDNILMPVWASRLQARRGAPGTYLCAHARSRRYVQATRLSVEWRTTKNGRPGTRRDERHEALAAR